MRQIIELFATKKKNNFSNLDPETFMRMIEEDHSAFLLDVRGEQEIIENGELEFSTSIDIDSPYFEKKASAISKDYAVYVYSQKEQKSMKACMLLQEMGFENIHRLKGGFEAYKLRNN